MRILVAGAGGFIGSRLVPALLDQGHGVRALDVVHGQLENATHPNLEWIAIGDNELHGGMANRDLVDQAVRDIDIIYHLALSWFNWGQMPPLADLFNVNIRGTLNLLEAAKAQGVRHFLYASSEAVYGTGKSLIVNEEDPCHPDLWEAGPGHPQPEYGILKLALEKLCLRYHRHGIPVTVFRIAVAFDDEEALLISPAMLKRITRGEPIRVLEGAGRASIHLDEVIQALLLATMNEKTFGQVFNLSNPATYLSDRELYQFLIDLTDSGSRIELIADPTHLRSALLSVEKIQHTLGWKPQKTEADLKEVITHNVLSEQFSL